MTAREMKKLALIVAILLFLYASPLKAQVGYVLTSTSGYASSAIGNRTVASGSDSTALGLSSTASGVVSLASGYSVLASGSYSVAFGIGTSATGIGSMAWGGSIPGTNSNSAYGDFSTAFGIGNRAFGACSLAFGYYTQAWGDFSTASGWYATANGNGATASGDYATASGSYSQAFGGWTTANGTYSVAFGNFTTANQSNGAAFGYGSVSNGAGAFASGHSTTASGYYSTASGNYTSADSLESFVVGAYNLGGGGSDSQTWVSTDPLFEIGNGTSSTPHDALEVLKNGNTTINGNLAVTGTESTLPYQTLLGGTASVLTEALGNTLYMPASPTDVGIGTGTPGNELQVGSGSGMDSSAVASFYGPSTSGGWISVGGSNAAKQVQIGVDSTAGFVTTLSNQPIDFRPDNSIAMTVLPDGYVGIGTTSPSQILTIVEPNSYSSAPFFTNPTSAGTSWLYMGQSESTGHAFGITFTDTSSGVGSYLSILGYGDSTPTGLNVVKGGNVGIGTTTPGYPLQVNGGGGGFGFDAAHQIVATTFGSGGNLTLGVTDSGSGTFLTDGATIFLGGSMRGDGYRSAISFVENNAEYMCIDGNASGHNQGYVGINTATPQARLDVNGNTYMRGSVIVTGSLTVLTSGTTVVATGTNLMLVPQQGDLSMGPFTAGAQPL